MKTLILILFFSSLVLAQNSGIRVPRGSATDKFYIYDSDSGKIDVMTRGIFADSLGLFYENVKNYGLKGDNSTDDSNVLESMVSTVGSAVYFFPKGVYLLDDYIDTISVPITIIGEDRDSTILVFDKSDRTVGFTITNSFHLENLTVKTGARTIKIPAELSKEIPYFILRNVLFDDVVEKCVVGFRTAVFANATRINYGEISNCEVKNSDGGFRLENMFKNFKAFNNYIHSINDTISEPKSVGYNNGAAGFYIGNVDLHFANDSGHYEFYSNTFNYFRSDLRQNITGVSVSDNTLYIPDNTIDSNEVLVFRPATLTDTLPSPILQGGEYRVVYSHNDTIKISTSQGGSPLDITTTGTGTFNAFAPAENKAVLCYGDNVSIHDNQASDFVTQLKYESEVFYVRANHSGKIDNNIIINAGTGDGIISLKTGYNPEQASISGNYIYKDNGDYEGDAIFSTSHTSVQNNTIILKGNRTGTGTAGGVYLNAEYEFYTKPILITGNSITVENEDNAIAIKSEYFGNALIDGNNIYINNDATAYYMLSGNTFGVDPDSLFITNVKITNNLIQAEEVSRVYLRQITGGVDFTGNTIIIDSINGLNIIADDVEPYINISDNTYYVRSVLSAVPLIQLGVNGCDINLDNNRFYMSDGIAQIFLFPSGSDARNLIIKDNVLIPADSAGNDITTFFYIQGSVTSDLIIENNLNTTSDYIDVVNFILLNETTFGDVTIKNNIANSQRFIQYRDTVTTLNKTVLRDNKFTGSVFLYPHSGVAYWSKGFEYISKNVGYQTSNVGTAVITSGDDSTIVNHNLNITPSIKNISVTSQSDLKGHSFYIDSVGAGTFTIKLGDTSFAALSSDVSFSWNIDDNITVLPFEPSTFDDNNVMIFDGDVGLSDTLWEDIYNDWNLTLTGTPTVIPDAINGHDALRFDGVDDRGITDNAFLTQPTTVYIVFKQITWTLNEYVFGSRSGSTRGILQQIDTTPELKATADASGVLYSDSILVPLDTYTVVTAVFNGASSVLQRNKETAVTGDFGNAAMDGLILADRSAGSRFSNIEVAYVIVRSNADDNATRIEFQDWLIERFGL